MVKDPINVLPRKRGRQSWAIRLGITLLVFVVAAATLVGALAWWPRSTPAARTLPTPAPTFLPKVGDVGDLDDGITVALGTTPAFQFQSGGYTLSGVTVNALTKQAVSGVSVWIYVPPVLGESTAPELRSVSTANGTFSFSHLAAGRYNLAAARYYVQNGQPVYPEVVQAGVTMPHQSFVRISLVPQSAPGARHPVKGVARNLIVLDLSGIYAESWFNDPLLQLEASNMRALAASGAQATRVVAPYGWHPADQYALLSGTYPSWRVLYSLPPLYTPGWPAGVDTTLWYKSDPPALEICHHSPVDLALVYVTA